MGSWQSPSHSHSPEHPPAHSHTPSPRVTITVAITATNTTVTAPVSAYQRLKFHLFSTRFHFFQGVTMLFGCYVMCRPFLFSPVFSNAFAGTTFQFVIPWMFVHGFLYFIFPFFLLFTLLCAPKRCQSAGAISRPRAERCFGSMVGPAPCCTQKKCTQDAVFGQKKCSYHTRYTRTRLALRCCCSAGHMVRVFNHACPRLRIQELINSKRRKHITPAELSRIDSQLAELRENGLESFLADAAEVASSGAHVCMCM